MQFLNLSLLRPIESNGDRVDYITKYNYIIIKVIKVILFDAPRWPPCRPTLFVINAIGVRQLSSVDRAPSAASRGHFAVQFATVSISYIANRFLILAFTLYTAKVGRVRFGSVRFGSVQFGSVQLSTV